jgi:hypothetical protein
MKVYDGANWIAATAAGTTAMNIYKYVATAAQTTFSGAATVGGTLSYTSGNILVFVNGASIDSTDYTATNGTSVVLGSAASLNDEVVVVAFKSFTVADTYTQSAADAKFVGKDSSTGAASIPSGTTAQRPATPASGMFRMNSTTSQPEWYDTLSSSWKTFAQQQGYAIEYLVVAGGGAGGEGGGGGGGFVSGSGFMVSGTSYTATVGGGGAGQNFGSYGSLTAGQNSSLVIANQTITALGGGIGGWSSGGSSGGCGGGGRRDGAQGYGGTYGQGMGGGGGTFANAGFGGAAGGGGAGGSGGQGGNTNYPTGGATTEVAGAGGPGLAWYNGNTYSGGGGGGVENLSTTGQSRGGAGGGGSGNKGDTAAPTSGGTNTGGGGGGLGSNTSYTSGSGGSGVVVIRYAGSQRGTGGTVTSAGGYTYHTFNTTANYTA